MLSGFELFPRWVPLFLDVLVAVAVAVVGSSGLEAVLR